MSLGRIFRHFLEVDCCNFCIGFENQFHMFCYKNPIHPNLTNHRSLCCNAKWLIQWKDGKRDRSEVHMVKLTGTGFVAAQFGLPRWPLARSPTIPWQWVRAASETALGTHSTAFATRSPCTPVWPTAIHCVEKQNTSRTSVNWGIAINYSYLQDYWPPSINHLTQSEKFGVYSKIVRKNKYTVNFLNVDHKPENYSSISAKKRDIGTRFCFKLDAPRA